MRKAIKFFTFFIAVLVFSSPWVTITQLHSGRLTEEVAAAQSAAEVDANTDVNKPLYFGMRCLLTALPFMSSFYFSSALLTTVSFHT